MYRRRLVLATAAVVALVILGAMPFTSSAASVQVSLNPKSGTATVDAFSNTTISVQVSNTSIMREILNITQGIFPDLSVAANLSGNAHLMAMFNSTLESLDSNVSLKYLSVSFNQVSRRVNNTYLVINRTSELSMLLTGVYTNGTANMTWRAFNFRDNLSLHGVSVTNISLGSGNYVNGTLNFSAFSVALARWNRTYNPSTNTTTFFYSAGRTLDVNITLDGGGMRISVVSDPQYSIVTPGYAVANSNTIVLERPPTTGPYYIVAVIVVLIVVGAALYFSRRRYLR
ncbi:hypothetical protein GCM10007108_06350 [Thermogymnomonas acidicola]|uniref:Uncharacterized protein n=1 Tax=Thermogymnomonas acidicola TaxID=399579 RepID=A0AA37BQP3_9ARCH|nr:hypothetical protein [Thermogymnomonas acidicola]GGM71023.1 hypothetical protein GCM10007108_06350 [Thermogymnomonas acidicola]